MHQEPAIPFSVHPQVCGKITPKTIKNQRHTQDFAFSIRHHTSSYVSIRQHTVLFLERPKISAIREISQSIGKTYLDYTWNGAEYRVFCASLNLAYSSIRQHTPAYASIRRHTSAYVWNSAKCLAQAQTFSTATVGHLISLVLRIAPHKLS